MTAIEKLIELKNDFKNKEITFEEFVAGTNVALLDVLNESDEYKVQAFNKLANMLADSYKIVDHEGTLPVYVDDDTVHYVFEAAVTSVYGNKFFKFYNDVYEC